MKKYKFLVIAFIFMAIFLALPTNVNASTAGYLVEENLEEVEPPYYIESVLGEKIYLEDENGNVQVDKTAEYGMKYDKATNTLTLDNYDGFAFICSMKNDFKIKVVGENIIHPVIEDISEPTTSHCIETYGRMEFIGDGKLTLDVKSVRGIDAIENPEDIWHKSVIYCRNNRRVIFNGPEFIINNDYLGPSARTLEIKSGKVITNGFWNDGGEVVISGGEVEIDGTIETQYNMHISGGKVKIKGLIGIYINGYPQITGGTVEIGNAIGEYILGENMAVVTPNVLVETKEQDGIVLTTLKDKETGEYAKNIKLVEYNFKKESEKQEININESGTISFTIDSDYEAFKNGGKVFVDGKEIGSDKYTAKAGSTIITLNEFYAKSLTEGEHTIAVEFANGAKVATNFTLVNKPVVEEEEQTPAPDAKPETDAGEKGETEVAPDKTPEAKPEIKDEVTDNKTEVKDETPDTGRQEVNMQAIIAIAMLGVVGTVVISKKRA